MHCFAGVSRSAAVIMAYMIDTLVLFLVLPTCNLTVAFFLSLCHLMYPHVFCPSDLSCVLFVLGLCYVLNPAIPQNCLRYITGVRCCIGFRHA